VGGTRRYKAVFEQGEDGWIVVHVPALPGTWTQGRTYEEAHANAREAIELMLEAMIENGEPIPEGDVEIAIEVVEVSV
jgi:predicted RNase H-like HicB family nuclease